MADANAEPRTDAPDAAAPAPQDAPPGETNAGGREPSVAGATELPEGLSQDDYDRQVFQRLADETPERPGEPAWIPPKESDVAPAPGSNAAATTQPDAPAEPATPDGADHREAELVARSALQRDGWPKPTIDRMVSGASPDELRTIAESARTRQAGYDRLGNEVRDLKRKVEGGGSRDDDAGEGDDPTAAAHADPSADEDLRDLTPTQAKLIQRFRDQGDEETAELQLAAFRELNERTGRGQGSGAAPTGAQALERLREPLDQLQVMHPRLADDAERIQILETAERLMQAGVVEQDGRHAQDVLRELLAKAASVRYGEPDPQEAQRRLHAQHDLERNGQPTPGSQRGGHSPTPATEEDADRAAFRALMQGKDPDQAAAVRHAALTGSPQPR